MHLRGLPEEHLGQMPITAHHRGSVRGGLLALRHTFELSKMSVQCVLLHRDQYSKRREALQRGARKAQWPRARAALCDRVLLEPRAPAFARPVSVCAASPSLAAMERLRDQLLAGGRVGNRIALYPSDLQRGWGKEQISNERTATFDRCEHV